MNRRKFFGFGAGAAIAGPAVAQEAVNQVAGIKGIPYHPPATGIIAADYAEKATIYKPTKQSLSVEIRQVLARIKELKEGVDYSEYEERRMKGYNARSNIECLKSVSSASKQHMIQNADRRIEREHQIFDMQNHVNHLKKSFFDQFKIPFIE